MIPTLLLVGLVLGRWWRVVIPAATIGWVVLLLATGVDSGSAFVVEAAALALVNVAIGVLVFQAGRSLLHRLVNDAPSAETRSRSASSRPRT